jgi:hypothetical protein
MIGEWPFCPHGRPLANSHGIQTDEAFIGGLTIENMGHEPVTVYSRTEFKQEMLKRNLEQRIKWAGETDRYLTNWAASTDPQTLENARYLVTHRMGKSHG